MKKFRMFTAAVAAVTIASSMAGCSAPGAITIGSSTKNAATIDGFDIRAGVFIYNEIDAYNEAAYKIYEESGSYPSLSDVKDSRIEDLDAADWIQNRATDYCKRYVAIEKEFEKVGGELSDEDNTYVDEAVEYYKSQDIYKKNGVGEESIREVMTATRKQQYLFNYYYGIDKQFGCSEEELKEYYIDNTARIKYFQVSLTDTDGNKLEGDELREINKKIDDYVKQINEVKDNLGKMQKLDEMMADYTSYIEEKKAESTETDTTTDTTTEAVTSEVTTTVSTDADTVTTSADENETTTTADTSAEEAVTTTSSEVTTTAVSGESDTTTTTTTTSPYENEVTITKYTTTAAPIGEAVVVTTAAETDAQKASREFNEKVFNDMSNYKAERYDYDENTVYIVIKGDIKDRMTDDDLWSEDVKDDTILKKYSDDYTDMIESLAKSYDVDKNKRAYKRYAPFKLKLDVQ